jgi:3-oxoacyl-[acyl-carrier protein] reductase
MHHKDILKGKTALVCGSTQGIGFAAAKALAELGASVVLMARNPEKLADAKKALPITGNAQHSIAVADFSQPDSVSEAVQQVLKIQNIHILVNNTGGPPGGPILQATPDAFRAAFESHLICNHILATACVPGMRTTGYGRIINVISTSVKAPLPGLGVSNTIRAAVGNWSKTLASELAPDGITVNNVLPGATETERLSGIIKAKATRLNLPENQVLEEMKNEVPMKRFGQPAEIAAAIAFLASPDAAYISGINIPVDGGRTPNL